MTIHYTSAETINATFSITDCIEKIDRGSDNLYIVDGNGNYTGQALIAANMYKLWQNDFSCIVNIPAILYETVETEAEKIFRQFPQFTGFPVVLGNKILGTVTVTKPQVGKYKWEALFDPLKPFEENMTKVYISSLEHEDIYKFYCQFANRLPITLISDSNINDVFCKKEGTCLIYGFDVFPNIPKISIHELWRECYEKTIAQNSKLVRIYKDVVQVKKTESYGLAAYIHHFDAGHHAVTIVDDNGKFNSLATVSTMRSYFPRKNFPKWTNLYLEYTPDQEALKYSVAATCFGFARRELPIVKDGNVIATGLLTEFQEGINRDGEARNEFIEIKWNIISDDVAKVILYNRKRILLSSANGFLCGFIERFGKLFDIEIFDDSLLNKYLNGEYDLLIYGADVWTNAVLPKYSVVELYGDMLAEEVRRYLIRNNIFYYYVKLPYTAKNLNGRMKQKSPILRPETLGGEYFTYLRLMDKNTIGYNIVDGNRHTTNHPDKYKFKIYFFGPCTSIGAFVADDETIPSKFQRRMNQNNCPGYAVNCGPPCTNQYSGINELYRIMDTNFKQGDVVVHFGTQIWQILPDSKVDWCTYMEQFYDTYTHQYDKIFTNSPQHLHVEGNQIIADALFERLISILSKRDIIDRKNVPAMFKALIDKRILPPPEKNSDLEHYLSKISKKRVDCQNIGAIVMNCNPFTKGHMYLVDCALHEVDFLYVFVVEEDKSAIPFKDRIAIARENCENLGNVMVLPSGKFIISSITFAEYFQKDNLQNSNQVFPAQDVRLFGREIAPTLGITKRFAGEEPLDNVTRQYNDAMREILPEYGVEFVEIPRLKLTEKEDTVINATIVRKYLAKGDLKSCRPYLTEKTYRYLQRKGKRILR